jgi:hypothetical protein
LSGHQHLAFAVVRQAIADATNTTAPAPVRQSARRFLAGNRMYRFWSTLATVKRPTER